MAISTPSAIVVIESIIETVLPMLIMEDTTGYVPPQVGIVLEIDKVPVILEVWLQHDAPSSSTKKLSGSCMIQMDIGGHPPIPLAQNNFPLW